MNHNCKCLCEICLKKQRKFVDKLLADIGKKNEPTTKEFLVWNEVKTPIFTPTWHTADGRKIPIHKMTTEHLTNTWKWLEKNKQIPVHVYGNKMRKHGRTGALLRALKFNKFIPNQYMDWIEEELGNRGEMEDIKDFIRENNCWDVKVSKKKTAPNPFIAVFDEIPEPKHPDRDTPIGTKVLYTGRDARHYNKTATITKHPGKSVFVRILFGCNCENVVTYNCLTLA